MQLARGRSGLAAVNLLLLACFTLSVPGAHAEEPWRLGASLDTPDWLTIEGEARLRYESLGGQFRAGGTGGDQLLLSRTLVLVEADAGPVRFGLELQDSRAWLGDSGTPLSTSIVNPVDILQAYALFDAPGVLGEKSRSELRLGRQTVSIGSKRQIERVEFANVIQNYTGLHAVSTNAGGDELHALYVVPVGRYPTGFADLDSNTPSGDEEQWERRIWALHYRRANLAPRIVPGLAGEVFVYGLEEADTAGVPTPDRSYTAPGFRLAREPDVGRWDLDVEGALRFGTRRLTSAASDTRSLDVDASMLYAAIGYTFDAPWRPRLAAEYYYASGDEDPLDDRYDQHERLFGSRRTDLNNTSIHGPLTPANLKAPGVRLEIEPSPRWDGWFKYTAAFLASGTDSWVVARLRDPAGQSGDFIGHVLDGRVRYWLVPGNLRLELGASALIKGEFARNAPNAPEDDNTLFGYGQITATF